MTSIASALVNYTPKGSTMKDINASGNNTIIGGDGDDIIISFGGNCTIDAGAGNDQVGHVGDNTDINMGDGDDSLVFWADNSTINLGAGNDSAVSLDIQCGAEGLEAPSFIDNGTNSTSSTSTSSSSSTKTWQDPSVGSAHGTYQTTNSSTTTSTTVNTYANDGIHNTTIIGGDGNDSIMLRGTGNTLSGDAGNDTIVSLSMLLGSSTSSASSSSTSTRKISDSDPIGFQTNDAQYDFITDRNDDSKFNDESELLGYNDNFAEMQAYDINGDGKISGTELNSMNVLRTDKETGERVIVSALEAGINTIDLSSYQQKDEKINDEQTLGGTFGLNVKGEDIVGEQTFDSLDYLKRTYGNSFGLTF